MKLTSQTTMMIALLALNFAAPKAHADFEEFFADDLGAELENFDKSGEVAAQTTPLATASSAPKAKAAKTGKLARFGHGFKKVGAGVVVSLDWFGATESSLGYLGYGFGEHLIRGKDGTDCDNHTKYTWEDFAADTAGGGFPGFIDGANFTNQIKAMRYGFEHAFKLGRPAAAYTSGGILIVGVVVNGILELKTCKAVDDGTIEPTAMVCKTHKKLHNALAEIEGWGQKGGEKTHDVILKIFGKTPSKKVCSARE